MSLEVPLYRPFAALALAMTVGVAAVSGFLAWLALAAWGLAVGLTMARGAAARRA